jgi:hypothetical protein
MNPCAGHPAKSTRLSDLWLYWVTGLLTGTVPWCSLLDDHPMRWIFYLIFVFVNSYDNLNYSIMNPRAGHPAESTRFSDLWLYWVTGLLAGIVPWFSLLDDLPMKWIYLIDIFILSFWYCYKKMYYSHKTGVALKFILMASTLGSSSSYTISSFF